MGCAEGELYRPLTGDGPGVSGECASRFDLFAVNANILGARIFEAAQPVDLSRELRVRDVVLNEGLHAVRDSVDQ